MIFILIGKQVNYNGEIPTLNQVIELDNGKNNLESNSLIIEI